MYSTFFFNNEYRYSRMGEEKEPNLSPPVCSIGRLYFVVRMVATQKSSFAFPFVNDIITIDVN